MTGQTQVRTTVPPGPTQVRAAWKVAAVALAAAVLFVLYWRLSLQTAVTSDGAANALQAQDMLHGNLLLHNWWVSDVSFYTTELPQYMLIVAVLGLGPWVVHVAAAMTYTLLVVLAALLAKGNARGKAGTGPRAAGRGYHPGAAAQRHSDRAPAAATRRYLGTRPAGLAGDGPRPGDQTARARARRGVRHPGRDGGSRLVRDANGHHSPGSGVSPASMPRGDARDADRAAVV